jgi:AraC-like DNA-binding protein
VNPELPCYREVRPGPRVAPYVQCYWTITSSATPSFFNRVCPDGCADIIVDLAAKPPTGGCVDGRSTYAVCTMQYASRVEMRGKVHLLGVRFRPGGAERFFQLPMYELTDRTVLLGEVWGGADALERAVRDAHSNADRIHRLEATLLYRLRRSEEPAPTLRHAVGYIGQTGGTRSISEVEEAVGVGGRRLERHFREALGITPKLFSRVVRFRRTLALMRRDQRPSWSRLAVEAGYYDQAHLIREVRVLSGATPAELAAETRAVGFVQYESDVPQ